jgi:hypothetical protein
VGAGTALTCWRRRPAAAWRARCRCWMASRRRPAARLRAGAGRDLRPCWPLPGSTRQGAATHASRPHMQPRMPPARCGKEACRRRRPPARSSCCPAPAPGSVTTAAAAIPDSLQCRRQQRAGQRLRRPQPTPRGPCRAAASRVRMAGCQVVPGQLLWGGAGRGTHHRRAALAAAAGRRRLRAETGRRRRQLHPTQRLTGRRMCGWRSAPCVSAGGAAQGARAHTAVQARPGLATHSRPAAGTRPTAGGP